MNYKIAEKLSETTFAALFKNLKNFKSLKALLIGFNFNFEIEKI